MVSLVEKELIFVVRARITAEKVFQKSCKPVSNSSTMLLLYPVLLEPLL